jgi:type IV pilus assembly protein PilW
MTSYRHLSRRHQPTKGFSLVELMVAMVLGFIVIGGAISVYLASKRSLTEVEQVATLSENGRFALQLLGYSARHIGFYGGPNPYDIPPEKQVGAVAGDCTDIAAAYDTENSFFALRAGGPENDATSARVKGCITDAMPYTDVLVIKNAGSSPLSGGWSSQQTYVIAGRVSFELRDGADMPLDIGESYVAYPYRLQIYYIRDGATPTLSRKILAWDASAGSMSIQTEDLVQGVENMRFRFGYDSNDDGEVDTLANVTDVTDADKWDQVTSLQVFLLLASDVSDPNYTDGKTYQLGDIAVSPEDSVRRILLHSNMTLRNRRLAWRGGGQ